jgi:predicted phage tail protein
VAFLLDIKTPFVKHIFGKRITLSMTTKNDYLDIMGIQRWRTNFILPGALDPLTSESWVLSNIDTNAVTALLHIETSATDSSQAEIDKLLDAMLAAVKLKRDVTQGVKAAPGRLLQIIMGEMLVQKHFGTSASFEALRADNTQRLASEKPVLVTYHPHQLLADARLKRLAWEDLQGLL